MLSGHGSAWRRRRNSRAARIAVPLAIPMALGLTLGIIIAVSGGNTTKIAQSAMGSCDTATASASASAAAPTASASAPAPAAADAAVASASAPASASAAAVPCPSASASGSAAASAPAAAAVTVAGIPRINPPGRQGLAGSNAVDAAGNAFSFAQTQAEAADSTNCTVTVPDRPLTCQGMGTRWVRGDGGTWQNGVTEGLFSEAARQARNGQVTV